MCALPTAAMCGIFYPRIALPREFEKWKSDFVVEYPIWVSLTGELAVDGHNLIYCDWFEENVKKLLKKADSW